MNMGEPGFVVLLEIAGRKRQWKKNGRGPARHRRRLNELWPLQHRVREDGEKAAAQLVHLAEQRDSAEICRAVCAVLERCGVIGFTTLTRMLSSRSPDVCQQALVTLMYNIDVGLPTLENLVCESDGDEQHLIKRLWVSI